MCFVSHDTSLNQVPLQDHNSTIVALFFPTPSGVNNGLHAHSSIKNYFLGLQCAPQAEITLTTLIVRTFSQTLNLFLRAIVFFNFLLHATSVQVILRRIIFRIAPTYIWQCSTPRAMISEEPNTHCPSPAVVYAGIFFASFCSRKID